MFFSRAPYRIRMKGVSQLEYVEHDKKLTLEGERLAPNTGASLVYWFRGGHTWDQPQNTEVTIKEKVRIKAAIEQDFLINGTIVEVEISQ